MPQIPTTVGAGGGGGGSAAPEGAAGGDLAGTYPNPSVSQINGVVVATVTGQRTAHELAFDHTLLPTSGQKAALVGTGTPGSGDKYVNDSDARMTNARTPSAHTTSHKHGGSDEVATATPAANAIPKADGSSKLDSWITAGSTSVPGLVQLQASGGTSATQAVIGTDTRLTNSRAPTAHATSHQNGGSDEIATATPGANAIPKASASGKLTSWIDAATTAIAGLLSAAHFAIVSAFSHGTKAMDLDIEGGTYNANVTTSSLGGAKSRKWDGNTDGAGRYQLDPLPGRTGGNVVFRLKCALSASGSAGKEVVWKLSAQAFDTGDTLPVSVLLNAATSYWDVSGVVAKVVTDFDFTVDSTIFDQNKSMMNFVLERLGSSDARDDYANADGDVHLLAIKVLYTGYGNVAAPSAPP